MKNQKQSFMFSLFVAAFQANNLTRTTNLITKLRKAFRFKHFLPALFLWMRKFYKYIPTNIYKYLYIGMYVFILKTQPWKTEQKIGALGSSKYLNNIEKHKFLKWKLKISKTKAKLTFVFISNKNNYKKIKIAHKLILHCGLINSASAEKAFIYGRK